MAASRYTPPALRPLRQLRKGYTVPRNGLALIGHQVTFCFKALMSIPLVLKQYRKEVWRLLADVTWGNGAFLVGGGVIGVIVALAIMGGMTVGIEAYTALNLLNFGSLTGALSAFATTRELAPLLAAVAFTAQSGCRFTAQLGSMRINEEIDALESIAIRPLPYLVTTRMMAAMISVVPLYTLALSVQYIATEVMFRLQSGQGGGIYGHYFDTFMSAPDVIYSVIKVLIFAILTTAIQCYYGYYASGGPEGVGIAAGHAIRLAIIVLVFANLAMTLVFWGLTSGVRISG